MGDRKAQRRGDCILAGTPEQLCMEPQKHTRKSSIGVYSCQVISGVSFEWVCKVLKREAVRGNGSGSGWRIPMEVLGRNHSAMGDYRGAHLRRYSLGATPIARLKTRRKELSDPYPTADATSKSDILLERIMSPALCIRQRVRYSSGVWPKTVLNFKAKADLDMRASRASDSTDQLLSKPECIACMALLRCLSDMAANHPFGGAAELPA